ncbi:MAG: SUMF1/EgtB/PvdO family nonheme iron enzyme [Thermoguttaceae bacterium]|nr:SUMF1/EgtB/PvdO family nonheme iron enzyme [Thermoguttaceae bacterium]
MRRFLILLIFVLILGITHTSEARKLALLVGVDDYVGVPSLKCSVNDMITLKEALKKVGFVENDIQILITGTGNVRDMPTKEMIEQKVRQILSSAQPNDMVFFAFSGHGLREGNTDYFCPPHVDQNNLERTCVSISRVMINLAQCKAKFKWMVVDACRNESGNSRDARAFQVIPSPPSGIALFQSCGKGERSYEEERSGGNGYFTKNLAAALSGKADSNLDGKLTLLEVCTWTSSQTKAEVEKAENKTQRPNLSGSISDFILTENPNVPEAKELMIRGREKINKKEFDEGIRLIQKAIKLYPKRNSWKRDLDNAKKLQKAYQEAQLKSRESSKRPVIESLPSSPDAGDRAILEVDDVYFIFCWCPAGEFIMGSPKDELGRKSDEKQHRVRLTKGFWLLETEVTQEMWQCVMGNNPSWFQKGWLIRENNLQRPVEQVSWDDCMKFCEKLSRRMDYQIQLPTEAQWEYACRAGTRKDYTEYLDSMAWFSANSGKKTQEVKQKEPNDWGLYDMHGNVSEWCSDYYDAKYYSNAPKNDPENTDVSSFHVYRGGCWYETVDKCRSAARNCGAPFLRHDNVGFRVLLIPD